MDAAGKTLCGLLVKEVWKPWIFMVFGPLVDLVQMGSINVLSLMGLFQRFGPLVSLEHMRFALANVME